MATHPSVVRMQAALWRGKCEGSTELKGLGRLTWQELVALIDVFVGMMWTGVTPPVQHQILSLYESDVLEQPPVGNDLYIYNVRHASLRFVAWLVEGWPDSNGAKVGRELLNRWLNADRNHLCRHLRPTGARRWSSGPTNFEWHIQERLRGLAARDLSAGTARILQAGRDIEEWRWDSVPAWSLAAKRREGDRHRRRIGSR
jgi:hypothetical protein